MNAVADAVAAVRARAVLETSFWTAAYRAEIVANCLDLFEMVVPRGVETEILRRRQDNYEREYPYATLFRHLRAQMVDPPTDAPPRLPILGPGEAEAIPLALHMGVGLLINEYRGLRHAEMLGIRVLTVPQVVVTLCVRGVISNRAAHRKLEIIKPITAAGILADARRALDSLMRADSSLPDRRST